MKQWFTVLFMSFLAGCAQGHLDIMDADGKVVGDCSANFDWHWHGAQDSVNYILNLCAQEHIAKGYAVSDESILANDYTLPLASKGETWNKISGQEHFTRGLISEQQYGYILAAIEYDYLSKLKHAARQLAENNINKKQYDHLLMQAKLEFNGR
ncbi:hypothetical protein [Shewanella sp. SR44-3]|uniref:hypothetical protein n=1 Tax=Shewanella sp. SR44-3 TaxID=2760936 RepID=UPI0015FB1245|nr:hypothetical protein [Shewanella sp. SR44-3]MBB1269475.1 hypothetical protein [Shewanella sp. SR44-3]